MLVIVNPYATTVFGRLRPSSSTRSRAASTSRRSTPRPRGHATELCRDAARDGDDVVVAFGGDGTVNEAANGLAGTGAPLTCLPGGLEERLRRSARHPRRHRRRHRAPARAGRPLGAAPGRPGRGSTTGSSPSPPASASTPTSSSASTRTPRLKARLRELPTCHAAVAVVPAPLPRATRRAWSSRRPGPSRSRASPRSSRTARRTRLHRPRPIEIAADAELDSGDLAGAVLRAHRPARHADHVARACRSSGLDVTGHRHAAALEGVRDAHDAPRRRAPRSPCRSTATRSSPRRSRSSAWSRGRCGRLGAVEPVEQRVDRCA